MHPNLPYVTCATSSKEKTCDILTFAHFEEGNLLSENRNDAENGDKYDDNSIMTPLISKKEMDVMNSGDESDDEPMSTEMLEDIHDGSQYHPNVNRIETYYKIRDCIKKRQQEWKGVLKDMQNMGKGLHKVFKAVVKDIFAIFTTFG